ncbi:YxeA family protein [Candidatus Enterococcus mansonii]|nr:YxeA family protein [Enterococcus sp. 4G2_DIV0659]
MWGIVFVMITIIGLRMYTYNNPSTAAAIIDRLNPLVKTATLYTKTTENYEYKYPDATSKIENFTYVQTCYTNNGKKRKLEYISFGKKITPDKFLKITAKGQNVIMWEEISRKDLPQTVSRLLK